MAYHISMPLVLFLGNCNSIFLYQIHLYNTFFLHAVPLIFFFLRILVMTNFLAPNIDIFILCFVRYISRNQIKYSECRCTFLLKAALTFEV